jgi:DNA-directed RNA polymerase subunit H (RpoH/RPB5)
VAEVVKKRRMLSVEDKVTVIKEMRVERRKLMCAGTSV